MLKLIGKKILSFTLKHFVYLNLWDVICLTLYLIETRFDAFEISCNWKYYGKMEHWDSSFEYSKHMFWLRNKKIFFGTHSYLKPCFVVIGASRVNIDPVILTTWKIVNIFYPSVLTYVLVLIRTVSLRWFFWEPQHMFCFLFFWYASLLLWLALQGLIGVCSYRSSHFDNLWFIHIWMLQEGIMGNMRTLK